MMKPRSTLQNAKFNAMVGDIAKHAPLVPWKRAMAREAWKRALIAIYVHEARLEAYGAGQPDPFPVRPVPSSELTSWQMDELIEAVYWFASDRMGLILD